VPDANACEDPTPDEAILFESVDGERGEQRGRYKAQGELALGIREFHATSILE
jgi:hypothetical protein